MYIEVKEELDFDDLRERCWGQALTILEEISQKDKEDDLMQYLSEIFDDGTPSLTEINDILAFDWELVYDDIGMNDEEDED